MTLQIRRPLTQASFCHLHFHLIFVISFKQPCSKGLSSPPPPPSPPFHQTQWERSEKKRDPWNNTYKYSFLPAACVEIPLDTAADIGAGAMLVTCPPDGTAADTVPDGASVIGMWTGDLLGAKCLCRVTVWVTPEATEEKLKKNIEGSVLKTWWKIFITGCSVIPNAFLFEATV